ncbi:ATP-binding protein [Streptomyces melanogenes]|uniref:ATP-binding protein n=1 Tax=Streptomyces melanogenes TaxID=67326 RepID=A0ABZ1XUE2_9ACTN|nr:ATP-binding protein [Streptomyces melanogenes]
MAPGNALVPQLIGAASPVSVADVRRYAFDLSARPESAAAARRHTAEVTVRWGLCDELGDAAALVVSELVTNAVVHTAGTRVSCELSFTSGHLTVAVRDQGYGTGGPTLCDATDGEEGGRGLLLVDALSVAWGAHDVPHGTGRIVWARLGAVPAC